MEMMNIENNKELTMTHLQFAEMTGKRNDNVKRVMTNLAEQGIISITQFEEPQLRGGKPTTIISVNERDSYIVMAQLSPTFTAKLVDEWKEMKEERKPKVIALPTMRELATHILKIEDEKEVLQLENLEKEEEIKTISVVSTKKSLQTYTPTSILSTLYDRGVITKEMGLKACDVNESLVYSGYQTRTIVSGNKGKAVYNYYLTDKGLDFGVQSTSGVTTTSKWLHKIILQEDFITCITNIDEIY